MEIWKIKGLRPEEVLCVAIIRRAIKDYRQLEKWEEGARNATNTKQETYFNKLASCGRDARNFFGDWRLKLWIGILRLDVGYFKKQIRGDI